MLTQLGAEAALGSALGCSQTHFPVHASPVSLRCSEAQIIALGSRSAGWRTWGCKGICLCGQSPSEYSVAVHRLALLAGVSLSIPAVQLQRALSEPARGLRFLPCSRFLLSPDLLHPRQLARSATDSFMLPWFLRTRRESGSIWPRGNGRSCSVFFPLNQLCSWQPQSHLSWPSFQ